MFLPLFQFQLTPTPAAMATSSNYPVLAVIRRSFDQQLLDAIAFTWPFSLKDLGALSNHQSFLIYIIWHHVYLST